MKIIRQKNVVFGSFPALFAPHQTLVRRWKPFHANYEMTSNNWHSAQFVTRTCYARLERLIRRMLHVIINNFRFLVELLNLRLAKPLPKYPNIALRSKCVVENREESKLGCITDLNC